ncbi:hypothetical protein QJ368_001978 [Vibrio vulnificus]|nr:hypothetical protein [Vibrio vulnificus]ELX4178096.1 hypothetical protein [Vibrio vulnificus]
MNNSIVKNKILSELPESIDYLIACAGFEKRCLSMVDFLPRDRVKNVGLFSYKQFNQFCDEQKSAFNDKFHCKEYTLDNSEPHTIADSFVAFFNDVELGAEKPNLVVDISSFTREAILIILKIIEINKESFSEAYFFYRNADVSDSLSDGIINVRSILGYMGDFDPSKPIHLVVLSGFEYERAKGIIEIIEPAKISIGLGGESESITEELRKKNQDFTDKLIAYYSSDDIFVFEHSLINLIDAKNTLCKVVNKYEDYNVVIAPLNNKISTVAAGLLGISNDALQLCYSQMGSYNIKDYSSPLDDCIIVNIHQLL